MSFRLWQKKIICDTNVIFHRNIVLANCHRNTLITAQFVRRLKLELVMTCLLGLFTETKNRARIVMFVNCFLLVLQ